jgi:hypothetical protein
MADSTVVLWNAPKAVRVPASVSAPSEIAPLAKRLSEREQVQLVQAFDAGLYEMGAIFVWGRTMAGLKSQLADLGVEFLAEILDRPDIRPSAEVHEVLTDYETVRLAEDLGMVNTTQALRLRQTLELIAHFANQTPDGEYDEMMPEEALRALRTCVEAVLGQENLGVAAGFADFRRKLETTTLDDEAPEILGLAGSAYFFKRTVLRTLLASSKAARGAQLENALANLNAVLPAIWPSLKDPDRFTVGRAYAELHADGQAKPANGLRSALLKVTGFDYVPESLRSRAFLEAAEKVIAAHFEWNNFYNEPAPMQALASLGTSIPGPAFHRCMTAIILVRIGNAYGISISAQDPAEEMLRSITSDRWEYFFNECLPVDDTLLGQLVNEKIAARWCETLSDLPRTQRLTPGAKNAQRLLGASLENDPRVVAQFASSMLGSLRVRS